MGKVRKSPGVGAQEMDAIRREALEFAGIGLYRHNFAGKVLFMDDGAFKIFDLSSRFPHPHAVVGRNIADLLIYTGPRGRLWAEVKKTGHVRGVEYRFRTLRGIDKCVAHDSYLVKDAESGEDVIQVIMHDVTERKHAEEQLEHVLTGARCILWHAIVTPKKRGDFKWDIVVSNEPAAEKLLPLKRKPGQSYSLAWPKSVPREDRRSMDVTSNSAIRDGRSGYSQEFRCRRADGKLRWMSEDAYIQPVGKNRWLIIGVCIDTTERKQMEEALRVSQDRYRAIVDDQMEFITRMRPDTTVLFVNDTVCRYFGKTRDEMVGRSFLPLLPPEDRKRIRDSVAGLSAANPVTTVQHRVILPEAKIRWHEWTNRGLFGPDGKIVEIQAVGRDVTEEKTAEDRRKAVTEGLRAIVDITDELLSCHDRDLMFRRAVELARGKLGLERCAVFVRDGGLMRGTYGTDLKGQTTDERRHFFEPSHRWLRRLHELSPGDRRAVTLHEPYVEVLHDKAKLHSKGWVVVTPIQSADELLGVFSNDTAISRAPMDETKQELVSVFCSLLGAIIGRTQTEDRHRAMSDALRSVLAIADDLIACPDLDAVCRRAVERSRKDLGVERCSLFLAEGLQMRGSYGTNRKGETTDERRHLLPQEEAWTRYLQSLRARERRLINETEYVDWVDDKETRFGKGWVALTPIQTPTSLLGVFCNDTAITGAPYDETRQEIITVLCSLLGAIIERKRTEQRQRDISEGLRAVVSIADALISCGDLDQLYRRAVELARAKLGVERCAVFLFEGPLLRGTYGTNCDGQTTDEHAHLVPTHTEWVERFRALKPEDRQMIIQEEPYTEWASSQELKFGQGWVALTPIQSGGKLFGVFSNDAAITRAPLDETKQEIITILCSLLGAIIESRQAEAKTRRLAMAVEQEAEAVIIAGTDGAIQYVNPAFERMTGYTRDEALGKNPRILKSGKQDLAFYEDMWRILVRGGAWSGRMTNARKNGALYEVETTISPIRDDTGRIINYVATSKDITREVQLEQQFIQAQKMEALGRLAGGIAHDFNNLLTSILGYTRLATDSLDDGHPMKADLGEVIRAGERAATLTRQLLAVSRKQMIQAQPVNLNTVVIDMDKLLRRTLGEDIELVTLVDDQMSYVNADPGLIEQVIMNLAVNSRDAMPKGGTLTIETSATTIDETSAQNRLDLRPGEYAILSARDTGAGMSQDVLQRCFEPFFTTKEAGKGTGLGLSIVYSVVKQFDGHIEIESTPNVGTSIRIYFPTVKTPVARAATKERMDLPRGDETIVVVEDEDTVRRLTVRILESLGYTVLESRHGGEALLICERHKEPIHLVLTDVVMPHIGGQELIDRLLKIRSDFKVLYMSGFTDEAFVQDRMSQRSAPLLLKPFTQETLASKVRQVLDSKRKDS